MTSRTLEKSCHSNGKLSTSLSFGHKTREGKNKNNKKKRMDGKRKNLFSTHEKKTSQCITNEMIDKDKNSSMYHTQIFLKIQRFL